MLAMLNITLRILVIALAVHGMIYYLLFILFTSYIIVNTLFLLVILISLILFKAIFANSVESNLRAAASLCCHSHCDSTQVKQLNDLLSHYGTSPLPSPFSSHVYMNILSLYHCTPLLLLLILFFVVFALYLYLLFSFFFLLLSL